jgi:hypothetical protein
LDLLPPDDDLDELPPPDDFLAEEPFAAAGAFAPVAFSATSFTAFFPESASVFTFVSLPIPVALVPASTAPPTAPTAAPTIAPAAISLKTSAALSIKPFDALFLEDDFFDEDLLEVDLLEEDLLEDDFPAVDLPADAFFAPPDLEAEPPEEVFLAAPPFEADLAEEPDLAEEEVDFFAADDEEPLAAVLLEPVLLEDDVFFADVSLSSDFLAADLPEDFDVAIIFLLVLCCSEIYMYHGFFTSRNRIS